MKIALLCSGLGHIRRGHEAFARDLFGLVGGHVDMTLFKGGGPEAPNERVVDNLPRNSPCLAHIQVSASPKWAAAVQEQERCRIEAETFAHAALKPLLEGAYDVVHCLEREVCTTLHRERHLFARTPKIVFSNGGAIPARDLPPCDFVQEHTAHNLAHSAKAKAFMIPHGVDLARFRPGVRSNFRARHGIPADAFVAISVGTISATHKRMDHVIREVAAVAGVHLLVVGQETADTPAIKALGAQLLGDRVRFLTLAHADLPEAYAAADVFVLGSLFETFGIVYIEAMAMGLPVVCTGHVNQRSIVQEGIFIDMAKPGALAHALQSTGRSVLAELGRRARGVAEREYDLRLLRDRYLRAYERIAATTVELPKPTFGRRAAANLRNLGRRVDGLVRGRAE